jgi:hypothetical protein
MYKRLRAFNYSNIIILSLSLRGDDLQIMKILSAKQMWTGDKL